MLHVRLKRGALCGVFWTRIEKNHDLIRSKKAGIQIVPVGCGVIAELVFRRDFRKPSLGFLYKADVCLILLGGIERNDPKRWLAVIGAKA